MREREYAEEREREVARVGAVIQNRRGLDIVWEEGRVEKVNTRRVALIPKSCQVHSYFKENRN
jgi:uncharacterized protein YkvS